MLSSIEVHGNAVRVELHELRNPSGVPSFKIVARHGETLVELSCTMAPVDGKGGLPPEGHVQKAIDELRQRAAEQAVMREELRRQLREAV